MTLEMVELKDVCEVVAGQSPPSKTYNDKGIGYPFFQGKADFGFLSPKVRIWCSAPKKIAHPNDILISVRAPVGPTNLCNVEAAIGRGLSAVRPSNKLDSMFLLHFLRSYAPILASKGTGSTFSAVTQKDIKNIQIPLPPIKIQKQIVEFLDRAQALIDKRKEQIALMDQLVQSLFYDMFGDPVANPMGWDVKSLGDVGHLERGKSKHRPRNAPKLLGGKYPLIQTGDIAKTGFYVREYSQTYSELGLAQSKMWKKGTLCITIAANIAKTAILNFDACFPDSIVAFLPSEEIENMYVQLWFSFLQKIIEADAPESAQKNINLKILNNLKIPVPPITLQKKFAKRVQKIEAQKTAMAASLQELKNNFNSLMQRAFKGELPHDKGILK